MINEVMDVLVSQGLSPQKLSPNVLKFSDENLKFVFQADLEEDPSYYRLMLPDIEENMEDIQKVYEKASIVSSRFKVGKCVIIEKKVWLTVEGFYYDKASISLLIKRLIDVMKDMIKAYWSYGKEQQVEGTHE